MNPPQTHRYRTAIAAIGIAGTLLLAACGGSSSTNAKPAATAATKPFKPIRKPES